MIQINIRFSHLRIAILAALALVIGRKVVAGQEGDQPAAPAAPAGANASQIGTAFTYQGRLDHALSPIAESCDMSFKLFDAGIDGNQIGATLYRAVADPVPVEEGLFTVDLDFGDAAFNGDERYLEIGVLCPGTGAAKPPLETLARRQWRRGPCALATPDVDYRSGLR